jgi:hypothetical protein
MPSRQKNGMGKRKKRKRRKSWKKKGIIIKTENKRTTRVNKE